MKQNTPTNTNGQPFENADAVQKANIPKLENDLSVGTMMPNHCYLAGKTAFWEGLGVRDCPHHGPNGQAWLRGWHVARLMRRAAKHLDEHFGTVE